MNLRINVLTALTLLAAGAPSAQPKGASIAVYPPDVQLNTKADLQRFIVVATRDDGVTLDVTSQAAVKLAAEGIARLDKGVLYPVADGATSLDIDYQGFKAAATIAVKDATAERPISWHLDVMPIWART